MSDTLTLDNTNLNQQILREYLNQKRDELEKQYVPEARGLDFTRAIGWDNAFRYPKLDKVFETEVLEPLVAQGVIDRNSFNQLISENQRARSGWYEFGGGSDQKAAHLDLINNLQLGANANSMLNQKQFRTAVDAVGGNSNYKDTLFDKTLIRQNESGQLVEGSDTNKVFQETIKQKNLEHQNNLLNTTDMYVGQEALGGKSFQQLKEEQGDDAIAVRQIQSLIQQSQAPTNQALELQQQQIKNRQTKNLITGILAGAAILKGD